MFHQRRIPWMSLSVPCPADILERKIPNTRLRIATRKHPHREAVPRYNSLHRHLRWGRFPCPIHASGSYGKLPRIFGLNNSLNTRTSPVNTFALYNPLLPFTHIAVSFRGAPQTNSMPFSCLPLTRVKLSIRPSELSFSMFFLLFEIASISSYLSQLQPPYFLTSLPYSFKQVLIFDQNTLSVPLVAFRFSKIQKHVIKVDCKGRLSNKFKQFNLLILSCIMFDKIGHFLFSREHYILSNLFPNSLGRRIMQIFFRFFLQFYKACFQLHWIICSPLPSFAGLLLLDVVLHRLLLYRVHFMADLRLQQGTIFPLLQGLQLSLQDSGVIVVEEQIFCRHGSLSLESATNLLHFLLRLLRSTCSQMRVQITRNDMLLKIVESTDFEFAFFACDDGQTLPAPEFILII